MGAGSQTGSVSPPARYPANQQLKCERLMAISLKPWPEILDIRGCAWGRPVGWELPLNAWLTTLRTIYSHKNRTVTKLCSNACRCAGKLLAWVQESCVAYSPTLFFALIPHYKRPNDQKTNIPKYQKIKIPCPTKQIGIT